VKTTQASTRKRPPYRIIAASTSGTIIEWYDFFIYGIAATLVFGPLFFPQEAGSEAIGVLAALGTYAVGFIARPIGGVVFGHFGDKIGRKTLLQLSLALIGVSTIGIGLLPTYEHIGVWAPALLVLLRFVQGLALGGEWGGAVLLVGEHGGADRRGLWTSFPQAAVPAGNILATALLAVLSLTMSDETFSSWGWRIPFLASVVLVFVGYYIRSKVEDAPVFKEALAKAAAEEKEQAPVREVWQLHKRELFIAMGLRVAENIQYYIVVTFSILYLRTVVEANTARILQLLLLAHLVHLVAVPVFGYLSDRIGRKPVIGAGLVATAAWAATAWTVYNTNNNVAIVAMLAAGLVAHGLMYGPQAAFMSEMFPTRMRYTGISIGYQVTSIFAGALAPIIAGALLAAYDSSVPITIYLLVAVVISAVALFASRETRGLDLVRLDEKRPTPATNSAVNGGVES
jgi:metabolite-proton symporter